MQVRAPTWFLKRLCPICEQGSCLLLVACPGCDRLAVRCDEAGCIFPDAHSVASQESRAPESATCPGCGMHLVSTFPAATDAQIRGAGFTVADYE